MNEIHPEPLHVCNGGSMDIKDVYITSSPAKAVASTPQGRSSSDIHIPIGLNSDQRTLLDERTIATNARNKKLEQTNSTVYSINLITDQTNKITTLLKSVAGMATQAMKAPDEQISKLQDEVTEIMAEIQKVGQALRSSYRTPSLASTTTETAQEALDTIAPEPPTEPPLLALSTKAGILMTQNVVTKVQAQFAALQDSLAKTATAYGTEAATLRTVNPLQTDEDAFKTTVALIKGVKEHSDNALGAINKELLQEHILSLG